MNTDIFLNSIVTIIDENGVVTNYKKEVGGRHIESLIKHVSDNYPEVEISQSNIYLYEIICKNNNVAFLNFGKTLIDNQYKYDFYMITPELSDSQKLVLRDFIKIKDEYINSLNIFKYDKESKKLFDLNYSEKLKHKIDELELMLKQNEKNR